MTALGTLLAEVRACSRCADALPLGPLPVLQMHGSARILIAAQAPGRRVHTSGIPFDDASGDRLRSWLGLAPEQFYDAKQVAIVPMAFCFPGTAASGDKPPRPECAPAWRGALLAHLKKLRLTLVIGRYAQAWHLPDAAASLTETVRAWRTNATDTIALPHPSPRNNGWFKHNPWFERELVPALRSRVGAALAERG